MSYQICGNIITQRKPDGTLKKVAYDTGSSYIDLFAEMQALNQPHLDRLHQVFEWLDSNKSIACELGEDLSPITILQREFVQIIARWLCMPNMLIWLPIILTMKLIIIHRK